MVDEKPIEKQAKEEERPKRNKTLFLIIGSIMLSLAVLGGSFIGTATNFLATKIPYVKVLWSFEIRVLCCIPLAIIEATLSKKYKR